MPTDKELEKRPLLNGCSRSAIKVIPQNWKDKDADVSREWKIYFRFYDPLFRDKYPTGKLVPTKGMNTYKELWKRQQATQSLLEYELDRIDVQGFNPITNTSMITPVDQVLDTRIPTDTELTVAIDWAYNNKVVDTHTLECIKSAKTAFNKAATELRLHTLPIDKLRRSHVLMIFKQIGVNKKDTWTANNFNYHRSQMSMLFLLLIEECIIEIDPTYKIKKQKTIRKKREVLTADECREVDNYLRTIDFRFWVLLHIFYRAGCRRTEIVAVKGKDVNLKRQIFKALVKKGETYRIEEYTITNSALHFWKLALHECGPDDFVFSRGLKPGHRQVRPEYITKRWQRVIKIPLEIDADWYSLKHLHTTRVSGQYGLSTAAAFNNESERMVQEYYDVEFEDREHERKKAIDAPFILQPKKAPKIDIT